MRFWNAPQVLGVIVEFNSRELTFRAFSPSNLLPMFGQKSIEWWIVCTYGQKCGTIDIFRYQVTA